jgi:hypothetical protein
MLLATAPAVLRNALTLAVVVHISVLNTAYTVPRRRPRTAYTLIIAVDRLLRVEDGTVRPCPVTNAVTAPTHVLNRIRDTTFALRLAWTKAPNTDRIADQVEVQTVIPSPPRASLANAMAQSCGEHACQTFVASRARSRKAARETVRASTKHLVGG